jgi:hypothetical protein
MTSFSRISAVFTVIVLFALIITVVIMGTQSIGTQITHGNMVEHRHGTILSKSEVNNSLTFRTDSGQVMRFSCQQHCLTQLGHIQRHINEHAGTDVYYKQENNTLIAIDVD